MHLICIHIGHLTYPAWVLILVNCIHIYFIVDQTFERVKQRPRSLSDPKLNQCEKPENTFQQESLHIVANTERKRRLHAENKLEKLQSGQSLELKFPELQPFTGKKSQDTYGDDNSSMTSSTSDEG